MKKHVLISTITQIVTECSIEKLTGNLTIKVDFTQGGIGHAQAFRESKAEEPNMFITRKTVLNGIN